MATSRPHLGHPDRYLRAAARLALEHQPVQTWRGKVTSLLDPHARVTAVMALARHGVPADQPAAIKALQSVKFEALSGDGKLDLLRSYGLVFIRLGKPRATQAKGVIAQLDRHFPVGEPRVDAELARLLAYLEAPSVVSKTVALMAAAETEKMDELLAQAERNESYGAAIKSMANQSPHRQRMLLASMLRHVKAGWTLELRKQYFRLINESMTGSRGGNLYYGGWRMIRQEAIEGLSEKDKNRLAGFVDDDAIPDLAGMELPSAQGPGSEWTVRAVVEKLEGKPELMRNRSFENGKTMYAAATCVLCHRFGTEGGSVGPDLSAIGSRFSLSELLDSIVNPSAVVSDQYEASMVHLKDGSTSVGRIVQKDDENIALMPNMFAPQDLVAVPTADVASIEVSPFSQMPAGLINSLNFDEVLDLLAYLLSGANPQHAYFKP